MLLCEGTIGGLYELSVNADGVGFWCILDDKFVYSRFGENKAMTLLDAYVVIGGRNFAKVLLPSGVVGYVWRSAPVYKLAG
jgi:hypothetical protein